MRFSWKAIAVTAVLAVGVAASVAVAATPSSGNGKGRVAIAADPQEHLAALAKKLGVKESELSDALDAARDKLGPPPRFSGRPPSRSDFEKRCNQMTDTIASELNLSGDTVRAAIKSVAKDDIEAAVKAGRLTQDQADRILQRIDSAACLPALGPPGHGGIGCGPGPAPRNGRSGNRDSVLPAPGPGLAFEVAPPA